MSHLSILPTLVKDLDLLASALRAEGFVVEVEGQLSSFGTQHNVALAATHSMGFDLGWTWNCNHDSLDVVVDLGRPAHSFSVERVLSRVLRRYALQQALRDADHQNFAVTTVDDQVALLTPASVRS
ncbi:MAG: DUF1257 domain-containing protein [Synechococcus sp. BS307-5m-G39]|nr:DUF1257 domain-containing protein [Synechococcus sp. BS307-5m-G39]